MKDEIQDEVSASGRVADLAHDRRILLTRARDHLLRLQDAIDLARDGRGELASANNIVLNFLERRITNCLTDIKEEHEV